MRVPLHYCSIHESPRVSFIGIAYYIFNGAGRIVAELPFHPCGEACAAPAAQSRFLNLIDDLLGLHLQRFDKAFVTAVSDIVVYVCGVYIPAVAQNDTNLWLQYGEFEESWGFPPGYLRREFP